MVFFSISFVIFYIFEAEKPILFSIMRKLTTLFLLLQIVLFSVLCSCTDKASKPYQEMEKKVGEFERKVQETDDCDELQLLGISILGLMSDLENLQQDDRVKETELATISNMITGLEATLNGKVVAKGCNQHSEDDSEIDVFGEDEYEDYDIL